MSGIFMPSYVYKRSSRLLTSIAGKGVFNCYQLYNKWQGNKRKMEKLYTISFKIKMTGWNRKWQGEGPFYHSLDITLQSPLPLFSDTLILIQYRFSIFPLSPPSLWQVLETRQFARWYHYCSLHAWLRQCVLLVISA